MLPLVDGDPARAQKAAKAASVNVGQYYVDLCTLPYRDIATFDATNLDIVGAEKLEALKAAGPVVALSAHTGNAELAIQALTVRGRPFAALVEPQHPRSWARYLLRLRSSAGGRFYEANFRGIRACIETLQEGGLVGFMADRDLQGNGLCVPLAGNCVRLPRGPWEIARRADALVYPMFANRVRHDHFRVYVEDPFRVERTEDEESDIAGAIQRFARLLEMHLRRDPSQWAVTEDFWKAHACG
jgi:KDO2-lipid IV(A) lauroyltransferase